MMTEILDRVSCIGAVRPTKSLVGSRTSTIEVFRGTPLRYLFDVGIWDLRCRACDERDPEGEDANAPNVDDVRGACGVVVSSTHLSEGAAAWPQKRTSK